MPQTGSILGTAASLCSLSHTSSSPLHMDTHVRWIVTQRCCHFLTSQHPHLIKARYPWFPTSHLEV